MLLGLIGKSLKHSFSKTYFEEKFRQKKLQYQYQNFEIHHIDQCQEIFLKPNLRGFNVTNPYKTEIIPYLHELSPEALQIGAVNTVSIKKGKRIGHNTDCYGFSKLIEPLQLNSADQVMILGTGGAAKAVAYTLKQKGINPLIISRFPKEGQLSYSDLQPIHFEAVRMIVQTTPLGMYPELTGFPPINYDLIYQKHILVDLIYNPIKSVFLQLGERREAQILNGYAMLTHQADKAWEIWCDSI